MVKEYKLMIQTSGINEREAVESAVRILNLGASFDEITYLNDVPEPAALIVQPERFLLFSPAAPRHHN
jgi:hypothetical protein